MKKLTTTALALAISTAFLTGCGEQTRAEKAQSYDERIEALEAKLEKAAEAGDVEALVAADKGLKALKAKKGREIGYHEGKGSADPFMGRYVNVFDDSEWQRLNEKYHNGALGARLEEVILEPKRITYRYADGDDVVKEFPGGAELEKVETHGRVLKDTLHYYHDPDSSGSSQFKIHENGLLYPKVLPRVALEKVE